MWMGEVPHIGELRDTVGAAADSPPDLTSITQLMTTAKSLAFSGW